MKFFILILFISSKLFAQVQNKDTLYFNHDEKYILFSDLYNSDNYSYKEFEQEVTENIKWTGTEGYFLFKIEDTLYNLNPKKIHSLKGYVEQRKFYYPGKYSRTINRKILKKEVFNKYVILLVDNNHYIKIRQHPHENFYNSYYPIKFSSNQIITKSLRDTIYINYDKNILQRKKNPNEEEFFYLINGFASKSTLTYFSEKEIYSNLEPTKIHNLQEIINEISEYNANKRLRGSDIFDHFSKAGYVIFIIKEDKYVKVEINSWIE